jgi:hypothetical protein
MAKEDTQSNQLNLTVVALVAVVAIVGLVALVINVSGTKLQFASGVGRVSASPEEIAEAQQATNLGGDAVKSCRSLRQLVASADIDGESVASRAAGRLLSWGECFGK